MPDPQQPREEELVACPYAIAGKAYCGATAAAASVPAGGSCPYSSGSPATLIALLEYIRARPSGFPVTLIALLEAAGSDTLSLGWAASSQPPCSTLFSLPNPAVRISADFLRLAVKHNYLDCVRDLLRLGANVEAVDDIGLTPLLVATRAGNTAAIAMLIEVGSADVNSRGQTVWTALHFAASGGDPATIEALVTRGGDLFAKTMLKGMSPLHVAAGHAETRAVQELVLRWGADEAQLDGRGRSASDIAGALKHAFDRGHRHAEEVERIKVMLANAPAERRWSRRRAVVLLVSRLRSKIARERSLQVEESNAAKKRGGAEGGGATAAAAATVLLGPVVVVLVEDLGDVRGSSDRGSDVESGGGDAGLKVGEEQVAVPAGMEAFRGAVTRLAGEDDIGIFRSVVGFL